MDTKRESAPGEDTERPAVPPRNKYPFTAPSVRPGGKQFKKTKSATFALDGTLYTIGRFLSYFFSQKLLSEDVFDCN